MQNLDSSNVKDMSIDKRRPLEKEIRGKSRCQFHERNSSFKHSLDVKEVRRGPRLVKVLREVGSANAHTKPLL